MRFSTVAQGLLASAGLSMANMCTIIGYNWEYQDPFSGQSGIISSDSGFELYYVGGVHISGTTFSVNGQNGNPEHAITLDQSVLHTAESIIWTPDFNGFVFEDCQASYEGTNHDGYLNGAINPCSDKTGLGWSCSYCSVDFECEGDLPAPN